MPQLPKWPLPWVERMLAGERSCDRNGGAAACAGADPAIVAASAAAIASRLRTEHRRDRAVRGRVEPCDHVLLRQLRVLQPPTRHLLAGADDQVSEQLHVLSARRPIGAAGVALDQRGYHLGVAAAHLVHRVHGRIRVQKPERSAVLVDVVEVGGDHRPQPLQRAWCGFRHPAELLEEPRATAFEGRLVEPLLRPEVLVEQRLGDSTRLGDLVHRCGPESARAEDSLPRVQHALLALPAREPAARGNCGGCGRAAHSGTIRTVVLKTLVPAASAAGVYCWNRLAGPSPTPIRRRPPAPPAMGLSAPPTPTR